MSPRTPLDKRLDASPETIARWAQDRAVAAFFAREAADDPAKVREAFEKYPVLTERQLAYRRSVEGSLFTVDEGNAVEAEDGDNDMGELRRIPGIYRPEKPDRRLSENRPAAAPRPAKPPTPGYRARAFLRRLPTGRYAARTLIEQAQADGISEPTLQRARRKLGIVAEKEVFGGPSFWTVPEVKP